VKLEKWRGEINGKYILTTTTVTKMAAPMTALRVVNIVKNEAKVVGDGVGT
jgi:hypothetical protein